MPHWLTTYLGSLQGGIVRTLAAEMRAGSLGTAWLAFGLGALHVLTPGHGKARSRLTFWAARRASARVSASPWWLRCCTSSLALRLSWCCRFRYHRDRHADTVAARSLTQWLLGCQAPWAAPSTGKPAARHSGTPSSRRRQVTHAVGVHQRHYSTDWLGCLASRRRHGFS
jgi:hypothetical protein